MTNLDLRDLPTRELLQAYQEKFQDIDSVILYLDLQKTTRKTAQFFDDIFEQNHLTEAKFTILMLLYRQKDKKLLPSVLAEKAGVKKATITGVVNGLEKSGFIYKIPDKNDKRATYICLSDQGLAHLESFLPTNYQTAQTIMANLTSKEKETLSNIIKKINYNITDV